MGVSLPLIVLELVLVLVIDVQARGSGGASRYHPASPELFARGVQQIEDEDEDD